MVALIHLTLNTYPYPPSSHPSIPIYAIPDNAEIKKNISIPAVLKQLIELEGYMIYVRYELNWLDIQLFIRPILPDRVTLL